MSDQTKRADLRALTGLRFMAATHVVFYHFAGQALPDGTPALIRNGVSHGYVGVSFFYLLSGFILSYNYLQRDEAGGATMRGSVRGFFAKRFSRIYPLYFAAWLLSAPLVVETRLARDAVPAALAKIGASAGVSLTLVQSWIPGAHTWWNPPGWSISVEAFFYLAFPWLVAAVHARQRPWLLGLTAYGLALATPAAHLAVGGGPLFTTITKYMPVMHLPVFVSGMLLAQLYNNEVARRIITRWGTLLGLLGLLGVALVIRHPVGPYYLLIHNGLLTPLFALVVLSLAVEVPVLKPLLSSRLCVLLGNASYGVYILQAPLWLYWRRVMGGENATSLVDFVSYFLLLCGVAILLYYTVEKPAQATLRQRLLVATK